MLLALGFSINLLTLLALVLAIGLVVDDAIIVVENVNRHLEEGKSALQSAYLAARELAGPIIAMTIVLIAVYVPIGFQGGLTGALFTEFAFTLAGSVAVSAVIALTLTPMLCSALLKPTNREHPSISDRLVHFIDARMESLRRGYSYMLSGSLNTISVTMLFAALVLISIPWLYANSKSELAPNEDQGIVLTFSTPAPNATIDQKLVYSRQVYEALVKYPETAGIFQLDLPAQSIAGWVLKPWDERKKTADQLQPILQQQLGGIAGTKVVAFQPPPLPGSNGLPIQFVIQTTDPFAQLDTVTRQFTADALKTGQFIFLDSDLKIDRPQSTLIIDKQKAAQLGIRLSDISTALGSMLGGGYVNYFDLSGRSYKVIPQVAQRFRLNSDQILNYYIKAGDGTTIPLSTIATLTTAAVPESLNHFQQINAATVSGVPAPGVIVGDALKTMKDIADRTLPKGYSVDYAGPSRQYTQESSGFIATFIFAVIIVFLALAAQSLSRCRCRSPALWSSS
jgi:multidrug efflux pump